MQPTPTPVFVWLLSLVSSRDESAAVIGDILEELTERSRAGLAPRLPRLWVNLQTIRALALTIAAALPRVSRSAGLILRDSVRALRAAPASSLFVILVLAIGVTVGTITFSVVDAVILRPLPVEQPEQLVTIPSRDAVAPFTAHITPEKYWLLSEHLASVEHLTARATLSGETLTVRGIREQQPLYQAGADIFPMLRWSAAIGRLWTKEDEDKGVTDVAVLGHRFWRERLAGDPSILGETVSLGEGRPEASSRACVRA